MHGYVQKEDQLGGKKIRNDFQLHRQSQRKNWKEYKEIPDTARENATDPPPPKKYGIKAV